MQEWTMSDIKKNESKHKLLSFSSILQDNHVYLITEQRLFYLNYKTGYSTFSKPALLTTALQLSINSPENLSFENSPTTLPCNNQHNA